MSVSVEQIEPDDSLRMKLNNLYDIAEVAEKKIKNLENVCHNLEKKRVEDRVILTGLLKRESKQVVGEILNTLFELLSDFINQEKEVLQSSKTFKDLKELLKNTPLIMF